MNKTHHEDGCYWANVQVGDLTYSIGPFKSRSAAYRKAVKEDQKHRVARENGYIYNVKAM